MSIDRAPAHTIGSRKWLALAALTLGVLAVGLDATVLSVALPTLAVALRSTESDLQWYTSGYALALAAGMLPAGLLGDRFGRRRVLVAGLVLFGAGSIACAYSPSPGVFITARVVLGLAGAAVAVMALSAVAVVFTEQERPRAVGVWAAANFLALPIGPIVGGWLLVHYWWGWVFLMNVPVALIGIAAVLTLLPESRAEHRPQLDPIGVLTSAGGLVAWTYGLIEAGQNGWTDPSALLPMAAGVVLIAAFLLWERRLSGRPRGEPMVDLSLFRSGAFTWGTLLAALGIVGMFGMLFTLPQYFQGVAGLDAQGSGLRLLPIIAGMLVGAVPADRVAARIGPKVTVALGFALQAGAMLAGSTMTVDSGTGFVAAWTAAAGAGTGLALSTAASAALGQISAERSGVATAVMQAFQKGGAPFGAAILGSALSSAYRSQLPLPGLPGAAANVVRQSLFGGIAIAQRLHSPALLQTVREAFVHGMAAALLVAAGVAIVSMILALAFLPGRRSAAAPATRGLPSGEPAA